MPPSVAKACTRRGIPFALGLLGLAAIGRTQVESSPVERLRARCHETPRDESAIAAAAAAVAQLPRADVVQQRDALLALVDALPACAWVPVAEALAAAAPWLGAAGREGLQQWASRLDEKAAVAVKSDAALLAPLARAIASLHGRSMVDAEASVEALLQPVKNDWEYARSAACDVLAERGKDAAAAADDLVAFLEKAEHPTGHAKLAGQYVPMADAPEASAARALLSVSEVATHRALAFAVLAVHATEPPTRAEAVRELMACGADEAAKYAERLALAAADSDATVVREVASALGTALPRQPAVRAVLERLATHADGQVRARSQAALRSAAKPK